MADVCLILEGTYPYVSGGVSEWVHNLITSRRDFTFSILAIVPNRLTAATHKYRLPPNVIAMQEICLHEHRLEPAGATHWRGKGLDVLARFHASLLENRHAGFDEITRIYSPENGRFMEALFSEESYRLVETLYRRCATADASFMDYFWTFRFTHAPLFKLLETRIPRAGLYHAACTGYAGFLGAVAKIRNGAPFLITEHGIYTNERRIEIQEAQWIYDNPSSENPHTRDILRRRWLRLFFAMSRIAYENADKIVTLFEGNRKLEIEDGADPQKIEIVPNGVHFGLYAALRKHHLEKTRRRNTVGFMGRVVSIKDVKTLLRAVGLAARRISDIRLLLMGPLDEDPEYVAECRELAENLGLGERVEMVGKVNPLEWYDKIDVLALSSLSEGQPLVLLEAGSAGIPAVATDVGACGEILLGRTAEDRRIGPGGIVTGVAAPEEIAQALVRLLTDDNYYSRLARNAVERMQRFYRIEDLNEKYRLMYNKYMSRE